MKSHFYHLQININYNNISFYKDLMTFMGWNVIFEGEGVVGYTAGGDGSVWFIKNESNEQTNYDNLGVNHISFRVEELKNVDEVMEHVKSKNIQMLFDTPKHRPEFAQSENETYYQIMFESSDKILFEVVYTGAK
ncbi:MAG TPA: hypothetical protein PLS49_01030 [Candidatus Woesebacteria bacterium]|nr:hypothetical protein [Candidatus Woesebacteria bacterium]